MYHHWFFLIIFEHPFVFILGCVFFLHLLDETVVVALRVVPAGEDLVGVAGDEGEEEGEEEEGLYLHWSVNYYNR